MTKTLLIYVAGPYSNDPNPNVRKALEVGEAIRALGHIPFIPHLCHLWDIIHPHHYEWWIEYTLDVLERCDAIYCIALSPGVRREVELAESLGLPVFTSFDQITPNPRHRRYNV